MRLVAMLVTLSSLAAVAAEPPMPQRYTKPSTEELKKKLTPEQFHVTQEAGTEPPFTERVLGQPRARHLRRRRHRRAAVLARPTSSTPAPAGRASRSPSSPGTSTSAATPAAAWSAPRCARAPATRTWATCSTTARATRRPALLHQLGVAALRPRGGARGGGLRRVCEAVRQTREGATRSPRRRSEVAILAGGCFWGMEELLRKIPGVLAPRSATPAARSRTRPTRTCTTARRATPRRCELAFDPTKLTYEELLEKWFFRMHDPTTQNRQGNDVGTQYRSAIFFTSDAQREIAEEVKAKVDASGKWKKPGRHRDRPGGRLVAGRGLPPGLPAEAPRRLHLPLPARLNGLSGRPPPSATPARRGTRRSASRPASGSRTRGAGLRRARTRG